MVVGGGSDLLFVTFHEFLTYVYGKYVVLKLSVWFMQIRICGVAAQHLGELEVDFPLSWFFGGIYITLKYHLILLLKYNNIKDLDLL